MGGKIVNDKQMDALTVRKSKMIQFIDQRDKASRGKEDVSKLLVSVAKDEARLAIEYIKRNELFDARVNLTSALCCLDAADLNKRWQKRLRAKRAV